MPSNNDVITLKFEIFGRGTNMGKSSQNGNLPVYIYIYMLLPPGGASYYGIVQTQEVTLTQVVISDYLGPTQMITTVPADPSSNFLPQIKYTHQAPPYYCS